jgi:branched-chain amino acid transport system permease protein
MNPRNLTRLLVALFVLGLYSLPSIITSQYYMHLISTAGIFVILVVGYNILYGMTGQLSFGHAGFFAIGAYAAGVATVQLHLPVIVGLALAVALSILFGIIVGVPTLRLKGHYLAVATIAFGEIVRQVISNWKPVTRGFDGIVSIPGIMIGNIEFKGDFSMYYVILTVALLGMLVSESIKHSTYGRILFAINDSEIAAEVMGVDTTRSKVIAFALSSVYAGIAGALYSHLFGYISPDAFDFRVSVEIVAMLLVGGTGSTIGAAIGAIVITFLPEVLRVSERYYMVIYGLIFLLILVFIPGGLISVFHYLKHLALKSVRTQKA